MKGLDLSRLYFAEICSPMLKDRFPGLFGRLGAGLVGVGSECFGFDDEKVDFIKILTSMIID